jgi:hypothetical protein
VDLPPPPVTIVDPNAPTGTADLLDSGRDPWRPSRRQVLVGVVVVLLLGLAAGAVAQVRHVRHEHALDAAAVRDVRIVVDSGDGGLLTDGEPEVTLVSTGRLPVTVLEVALEWPGHVERGARQEVPLVASARVPVTTGKDCRTALYTDQPQRLRVRARTSRGDVVTRAVALPAEVSELLGASERFRCAYLRPSEALVGEVSAVRTPGRSFVLTFGVRNAGVAPLTLSRLSFLPGVTVAADLPLVLPPGGADSRTVPLTVTLRVRSCAALGAYFSQPPDERPLDALTATVSNPYVQGREPGRLLVGGLFQRVGGVDSGDGLMRRLAGTCPATLFPKGFFDPVEIDLAETYVPS